MLRILLCLLIAVSGVVGVGGQSAQAGPGSYEAHLYAITEYTAACPANNLSLWDDMGLAWYNEITDSGYSFLGWCLWGHCDDYFTKDRLMINGGIKANLFTDPSLFAWGQDTTYLDEADAAMICTHGWDDGGYWAGCMREKDGSGDCNLNAKTEMKIGDYDLEFLHLSSCHSMDDNMIPNAYTLFSKPTSSSRLHQIDGFHGCMWIGSSFVDDYEDFADDAFDMSVGLAWELNMYRENVNGQWTQCPIAYAVGRTADDCISRLTTERYNNIGADPSAVNYYCYYYYPGCRPDCETTFGDDWSH
jgi:hypothetical protein